MAGADSQTLRISPPRVVAILTGAVGLLAAAHFVTQALRLALDRPSLFGLVPLFHLDVERTLPAWFSVILLASAAALLLAVGWLTRATHPRDFKAWLLLAAGFAFMSLDEMIGLHEEVNQALRKLPGPLSRFEYAWVAPAAVVAALVGLVFLPFLLRLPSRTRWGLVLAGAVYVTGALGFEALGSLQVAANGRNNMLYQTLVAFEEVMEMMGVVLLIHVLLVHLRAYASEIRIVITGAGVDRAISPAPARAPGRSAKSVA